MTVPTATPVRPTTPTPEVEDAASRSRSRARLRTQVTLAGRVLPTHYPLRAFIAVNPLEGLRHLPFEAAALRAGELYGARATLSEADYRQRWAQGLLTARDLDLALSCRYPDLGSWPTLRLGGKEVDALTVLRTDLLHADPAPEPGRVYRMRSEQAAPQVAEQVAALTARWCAAFLTADTATWPMPGHGDGFWAAWRSLAPRDRSLPRSVRRALRGLPARADDAALVAMDMLGVTETGYRDYLTAHLTHQPGWAAHVRWHSEHTAAPRIDLLGLLAVRLTYEAHLLAARRPTPTSAATGEAGEAVRVDGLAQRAAGVCAALGVSEPDAGELTVVARLLAVLPAHHRGFVWLEAGEHHYRDRLLRTLDRALPTPTPGVGPDAVIARPHAQVVCCIDVRSEGLRRHVEAAGRYETVGFAGFFAVAVRYTDLAAGAARDLCPVLIRPGFAVTETPAAGGGDDAARHLRGRQLVAGVGEAFHSAKDDPVGPFALAEAGGWISGPLSAARTLFPRRSAALAQRVHRRIAPPAATEVEIEGAVEVADRVLLARAALTTMSLTAGFARLVMFCGHGSTTTNNLYQASLDCGACGGQRGGPNARTVAALLNDPAVRAGLTEHGIQVPEDTWFVAAEHDTATDDVALLDAHLVPRTHRCDTDRLRADLATASAALTAERATALPGSPRRVSSSPALAARHARTRSSDWAQVYPEWGLAGNAAFVIGPRRQSAGADLDRRAFLHSYDQEADPDATVLETILTAPLVVAQWINAQYYFSSVSPDVLGAGTKTIHNALGGIGVLSGHSGDLRLGLPWQSVAVGDALVHEPLRLLAVISAPTTRIDTVVERNPVLQELFDGGWLSVVAREDPSTPWQHRTRTGWRPWAAPADPHTPDRSPERNPS